MDRTVRRIESTPSKTQHEELRPISAYDAAENIVLLGDPGAGKTYTFRECAARSGGRYVTARAFLVTPAAKFDGTLFVDGLDEKRAGRSDRDTVDALVEKLFEVGPGKVRISCRAADWLGDSDLAALRPYFELSGDPVVLQLGRLSGDEQRVVLQAEGLSAGDAAAFLQEATDRALGDFLENPQNLIMLLRAVQTGKWPATRKELFEFSTHLMLKEFDNDRARAGAGIYSVDELRPAAGAVCAARLISDIEAVSLTDNETSKAIPSYRGLSMLPPEKVIAALGRRVFVAGPVPESVDYAHRTTAEYLGAVWLADAVRSGMYDEAVSFFEHIVRKDRPVREILFADYDFLNQPLAKFYGVKKEIKSTGLVELVPDAGSFQRGGLLRLGAILTSTSAPLRTSPVKRGDWVLRRILMPEDYEGHPQRRDFPMGGEPVLFTKDEALQRDYTQ